jgi:hypothetical protein
MPATDLSAVGASCAPLCFLMGSVPSLSFNETPELVQVSTRRPANIYCAKITCASCFIFRMIRQGS